MQRFHDFPICTLVRDDADFPESLRILLPNLQQIWYRGMLSALSGPCLTTVGSRQVTAYADSIVELLLEPLVRSGMRLVSGLARGFDSLCHQLCLDNKVPTIAVLGHGLDTVFPADHYGMAGQILSQGGLIISPFPPGTPARKYTFRARNELLAALSPVIFIGEARERSGSLITAGAANRMGRTVCVVPSDITRQNARGSLALLTEGAHIAYEPEHIAQHYRQQMTLLPLSPPVPPALTGTAAELYAAISGGATTVAQLQSALNIPYHIITAGLTLLELDRYIINRDATWHVTSLS
jgi:DNA processing protein